MENQSFGEYLRETRENLGISMRSLATSADMDPAYLSRIENGKSGAPKQETVEKLGQALCTEQQLESSECERLKRRFLISAGLLQDKEDLIDDLAERFATRLRDEGFPDEHIERAIAQVSLSTMRAVLLGEEKLEIGKAAAYSHNELAERQDAGEEIVAFSLEPTEAVNEAVQPMLDLSLRLSKAIDRDADMDMSPASLKMSESAASYLDRNAEKFVSRRRNQRVQASRVQSRDIRAGSDAVINVRKDMSKEQEQQLRIIAKLIGTILRD